MKELQFRAEIPYHQQVKFRVIKSLHTLSMYGNNPGPKHMHSLKDLLSTPRGTKEGPITFFSNFGTKEGI